jgi:glutamate synthase (NADPH/NADH) large chain
MLNVRYSPDHDACGVGFVTQLGRKPSHQLVERALEALLRLAHRGGVDADGRSGDGSGLLLAIPDRFFRDRAREAGIRLPERFGLGMALLASDAESSLRGLIEGLAHKSGLRCLGWRMVPTDPSIVGPRALETLPRMRQCFFGAVEPAGDLETLLFRLRKQVEAAASRDIYFCSLSSRTVVYKGLLTPDQLPAFYADLSDPGFETSFALFHQRYSTNTQPSWSLAQPFRFVAHNGEINTISANRRWLHAKASDLNERLELPQPVPLLEERVSDSASFDNGVELLLRRGYSPASAMLAMVPPAWETNPLLPPDLRRYLESQAPLQEPWDGPAAMVFSDGVTVGAKLDRNGLRPLRYVLTSDGLLVVGSEVGIADFHLQEVVERQRLGPGEMLVCNPRTGEFRRPGEVGQLEEFRQAPHTPIVLHVTPTERLAGNETAEPRRVMAALGWTEDQYKLLFQPLVEEGQEAVWSMGDDAPPAFLSRLPRPLWDYCKQRFAQVTNPPIDPLRETHVMSLRSYLGERAVLSSPLLDAGQLEHLEVEFAIRRVAITFPAAEGITSARRAAGRGGVGGIGKPGIDFAERLGRG